MLTQNVTGLNKVARKIEENKHELFYYRFWGAISFEIEKKIGLSQQIQTIFGLIFGELSEFGLFPKIRTKVRALVRFHI